jgi:hypothetical protein
VRKALIYVRATVNKVFDKVTVMANTPFLAGELPGQDAMDKKGIQLRADLEED